MAGFTDTLRGDGLARAQRALAELERNPQRLDRARIRFDDSPPPYTSDRSGTTTRSQSPNPPSEEQRLRQERRVQLGLERRASEPYHQFEHQISEEEKRIWNADLNKTHRIPVGSDAYTIAYETVKKRWVEQGIWNSKWNQFADGLWKHEEPLEPEPESETDSEVGLSPLFVSFSPKPQSKPRLPKSDDEKRRIAERRAIREREREASRPYHQFVYQISKESERIQEESANREGASTADINTRAYENVKNMWAKRGIWNERWGVLPGMSWKHEQPFEEIVREEMGDDPVPANPLVNSNHETPAIRILGSPSPVQLYYRQVSGALNLSQQGPPADIALAGSENSDVERSLSAPNSLFPSSSKRVLCATTGQALLPSKRKASHKNGQPANVSLGPVYSLKVSKAAGKRKGPQRLSISQKVSSDGLPLSSSVDAAERQPSLPPDRVTPRRSKRIQSSVSSVAKDPAKPASMDLSKRAVRSKPERKVASNLTTRSSAKPHGVLKRYPAKTTRGKASKK
ncbi:hypothetical protein B0O99DRAFT_738781 [Bisporella sp. PMI_857]|nr:hypothetical protein B0O99DRAFT_738781 [Bisporella sp. PMI_857]